MPHPTFSLDEIPFSTRGSWLDISPVIGCNRIDRELHIVSHTTGMHPVVRLVPQGSVRTKATPAVLEARGDAGGRIRIAFESPRTMRLRGEGLPLRLESAAAELTPFTGTYLFRHPVDDAPVFASYETGRRYRVTTIEGALRVEGDGSLGNAPRAIIVGEGDDAWEVAFEELESERASYVAAETFDEVVDRAEASFDAYRAALAPWSTGGDTSALAAYVLWSATVDPAGFLGREAILMSKHWMDKVWSWDHCFNAIALARTMPDAAIDQFLLPFDHQADTGALPDSVAHSEILYNFVKPPIHGWAWGEIRARMPRPPTLDEKTQVYHGVAAWTRYWLDRRRADGTLPCYEHGNDSGWDNSTVFDAERAVESPDLAAFLVLQLDMLAELGTELGIAHAWATEADAVLDSLISRLWTDDGFVARGLRTGALASETSLLTKLPILAAGRIGKRRVETLGAAIARHLTPFGLATERQDSPHYEPDGYWRGPIWAPSTFIVERGLRAAGLDDLASSVRTRFLSLCERSGFAENFDALTGVGLRDRAYTWTASVYLILAGEASSR